MLRSISAVVEPLTSLSASAPAPLTATPLVLKLRAAPIEAAATTALMLERELLSWPLTLRSCQVCPLASVTCHRCPASTTETRSGGCTSAQRLASL